MTARARLSEPRRSTTRNEEAGEKRVAVARKPRGTSEGARDVWLLDPPDGLDPNAVGLELVHHRPSGSTQPLEGIWPGFSDLARGVERHLQHTPPPGVGHDPLHHGQLPVGNPGHRPDSPFRIGHIRTEEVHEPGELLQHLLHGFDVDGGDLRLQGCPLVMA